MLMIGKQLTAEQRLSKVTAWAMANNYMFAADKK